MFEEQAKYIEERLEDVRGDNDIQIIFDATRETPTRGERFLRLTIVQVDSVLVSGTWDNGVYRDTGLATIEVYTPKDQGTAEIFEMCDYIQQIYHNWQRGTLKAQRGYTNRLGQELEWFHMNVYVPFTYDRVFKAP